MFGYLPDGALRPVGGFGPVVVNTANPMVGFDGLEGANLGQEFGQLGLARLGEKEVVERLEAAALVGSSDLGAASDQLGEQFTLGPIPGRDLFSRGPVEEPEVLFDLAKVREQFPRGCGQLLVAVTDSGRVQHLNNPGLDGGDLGVEFVSAAP